MRTLLLNIGMTERGEGDHRSNIGYLAWPVSEETFKRLELMRYATEFLASDKIRISTDEFGMYVNGDETTVLYPSVTVMSDGSIEIATQERVRHMWPIQLTSMQPIQLESLRECFEKAFPDEGEPAVVVGSPEVEYFLAFRDRDDCVNHVHDLIYELPMHTDSDYPNGIDWETFEISTIAPPEYRPEMFPIS